MSGRVASVRSESSSSDLIPGSFGLLAVMVLLGSSTALAAKFTLAGLPVTFVPLVRFGIGGLLFLPWAFRQPAFREIFTHDLTRLIVAAAFCVPINQAFFLNGARFAPTSHVGLIYAACPLVVLALAAGLRQETLTSRRLIGVVATVSGVVVLGVGQLTSSAPTSSQVLFGDLLLVGAVVSWGAYLTSVKPLASKYGSLPTLVATFIVGALLDLPLAIATTGDWSRLTTAPPLSWWSLAYLSVAVTGIGLACQNLALKRFDASLVASVGNLAPVLTVLWGILFLKEPLTLPLILGGSLTFAGIACASGLARRKRLAPVDAPPVVEAPQHLGLPRIEHGSATPARS
jgi:drug/metabolite transporter (DMT)-like permease